MKRSALTVLVMFLAAGGGVVWGQDWAYLGPDAGSIQVLCRSPQDSSVVFAGTLAGGAWRSMDAGASWSRIGLPATVWEFASDPTVQDRVLAGTANGLYESLDGGAQWDRLGLQGESVEGLAVLADGTILAGTRHGIQISHDGGQSWSMATGLPDAQVETVAADPTNVQVAFAGTLGSGVFKTSDGGDTWTDASSGLPSTLVYTIVVDPQHPDHLWAGTWDEGVQRSLDGGASWSAAGSALAGAYVPVLAIEDGGVLWAGSAGAVWSSDDGGATWQEHQVGPGDGVVKALAVAAGGQPMLAGHDGEGVFSSSDGGATWTASSTGLRGAVVQSLAVEPGDPSVMVCGLGFWAGLMRSADGGASWQLIEVSDHGVIALQADPGQAGRFWAGTLSGGLYRSDDTGLTWNPVAGSEHLRVRELEIVGPALLVGSEEGVQRSTDGGATWATEDFGAADPWVTALASAGGGSQRVFAGLNSGGVYRSDDAGASWTQADSGLPAGTVWALALDPSDENTAYAVAGDTRVYRTVDGGATWAQTATQPFTNGFGGSLVVGSSGTLYFARSGVRRSSDGGATWEQVGAWNATVSIVDRLIVVSENPLVLLTATYGNGVWKYSEPEGQLWIPVVTHADGVGGSVWRSDLWFMNPGSQNLVATLVFHGASGDRSAQYIAPAGAQVGLADVVQLLGGEGSGSLEIRSESKLLAASRTYNVSGDGTFGQSYPAVASGSPLTPFDEVRLTGLVENQSFRTNIGFVNIGTEIHDFGLELYDGAGMKVAGYLITLEPGEWRLELRPFFNAAGLEDLDGGWARVTAPWGGELVALASVIDNATGDPTSILMSTPAGQDGVPTWIPVVAHTGGLEGSVWRSDVAILNAGDQAAAVDVTLHLGQSPAVQQLTLDPGEQRVLADVMDGFGASGSAALSVSSDQPLAVSSRTFNLSDEGTFGQSYPSQREDGALGAGATGWLLGLSENATYRTNIGLVNLSVAQAEVLVELFRSDGTAVASFSRSLGPGEWRLEVQPFASAGETDLDQGFARVTVTSGGGVWALGSVIDNRTNDPTTVIPVW